MELTILALVSTGKVDNSNLGEQISDSDFQVESAACLPSIVGVWVPIPSGAEGDDTNGNGNGDSDGVGDIDHSTRCT
jgi:hypothetical protein